MFNKILFSTLIILFCISCGEGEVVSDVIEVEWFYWCGWREGDSDCSTCRLSSTVSEIDTSGTLIGASPPADTLIIRPEWSSIYFNQETMTIEHWMLDYNSDGELVEVFANRDSLQPYIDYQDTVCIDYKEI